MQSVIETPRWRKPPSRPPIRPGDLHLWRIPTQDEHRDPLRCLAVLCATERARAERILDDTQRVRYLRVQSGLRLILARYLERPPARIPITLAPTGKPGLGLAWPALAFNLTTTEDLALLAISAGQGVAAEVGLDCERIRPRTHLVAIAARMFTQEVCDAITQATEPQRLQLFYRAWTALEADVKCDGRGLFRARPQATAPPTIAHWVPQTGYIAAVARQWLPDPSQWCLFEGP